MLFSSFLKKNTKKERIYLDHAAATPVAADVYEKMKPFFSDIYGNPSSVHEEGRAARDALEGARAKLAECLRVRPSDIVFTSGGTESNNLALFGVVRRAILDGRRTTEIEVISTEIEHPSILESLRALEKEGVQIRFIPVGADGLMDLSLFEKALTKSTLLITCAYANSEIGVVQDVKRITRTVRAFRMREKVGAPYVHIDASQAPLYLPCAMDSLGADLLTLDAAKCHGPKGGGVLVHRKNAPIENIAYGGSQEAGLRPGTENVALAVGASLSICRAQQEYAERSAKVSEVREYAFERLKEAFPALVINGSRDARIANNINVSIPGVDGEYAVVGLDAKGVAVSTQSACAGTGEGGSEVIRALGGSPSRMRETLRFTLGEKSTKKDIDRAVEALVGHVEMANETRLG